MKPPPGVPWDAGGGAKAEALTLSHLETDFRDAQVIDFAGGIFVPFLTLCRTANMRVMLEASVESSANSVVKLHRAVQVGRLRDPWTSKCRSGLFFALSLPDVI